MAAQRSMLPQWLRLKPVWLLIACLVPLVLLSSAAGARPALAAGSLTVNTLADETSADDGCSLREAITNANDRAATFADCAAGTGVDVIHLTVPGDLGLNSSLPAVRHRLTLDGSAAAVTLDARYGSRVIEIASGASLRLERLTIARGVVDYDRGGAIWNRGGELMIAGTTFTENSANYAGGGGAIYNQGGSLVIADALFYSNSAAFGGGGGAILNDGGRVTITRTTFTNGAYLSLGGAIRSRGGELTVRDSTFTNNGASGGGAISNESGQATVLNSTFYGNSSDQDAGTILNTGELTLLNVTLAGNLAQYTAGLVNRGTATLRNTILSGNTYGNCSGKITDGGYNLEDGGTCGFSVGRHSRSMTDPLLAPQGLMVNGGATATVALLPTSPAIDAIPAGKNGCGASITTDQRGMARPVDGNGDGRAGCDVGAYEAPGLPRAGRDLDLSITASPEASNSRRLTFLVQVTNRGTTAERQLVLTDALPAEVEFLSVAPQDRCNYSAASRTVRCLLPEVAPSSSALFRILVRLGNPARALTNCASVAENSGAGRVESCVTVNPP